LFVAQWRPVREKLVHGLDGQSNCWIVGKELIFGKAGGLGNVDLATLTSDVGLKISGALEGDYAGGSVRAAGDINGDGFADIVIGAPHFSFTPTENGPTSSMAATSPNP
jgi:hypothetical protein